MALMRSPLAGRFPVNVRSSGSRWRVERQKFGDYPAMCVPRFRRADLRTITAIQRSTFRSRCRRRPAIRTETLAMYTFKTTLDFPIGLRLGARSADVRAVVVATSGYAVPQRARAMRKRPSRSESPRP